MAKQDFDVFDFIVVGSGAGGGPLACNLAKAGAKVLLIEAGSDHETLPTEDSVTRDAYDIPVFHGAATEDSNLSWAYFVQHYTTKTTQDFAKALRLPSGQSPQTDGIFYPRAGTLGGCTSHYAMIMVYPHQSDWRTIYEAVRGDGAVAEFWNQDMRRYFERMNRWLPIKQTSLLFSIGLLLKDRQIRKIFNAAAQAIGKSGGVFKRLGSLLSITSALTALGDPNKPDASGGAKSGAFRVPSAVGGVTGSAKGSGFRGGTREYILQTINRVNDGSTGKLTCRTNCLVTRVIFDDGEQPVAAGVEYVEGERLYAASVNANTPGSANGDDLKRQVVRVREGGEVILCAGAFNTPQLLMLSGIGPADHLGEMNIEVVAERPGVGKNLQDRYEVGIVSEVVKDFSVFKGVAPALPPAANDTAYQQWKMSHGGLHATNGTLVSIIKKSAYAGEDPDLFFFGVPGSFHGYYPGWSKDALSRQNRFTWLILKGHTANTGRLELQSDKPWERPKISFDYFNDDTDAAKDPDLLAVKEGIEFVRGINETLHGDVFRQELPPSATFGGSGQPPLEEFIRHGSWGHHASCTCKIGGNDDGDAVLDARFCVRGVTNLRVVDASVFPKIPGFFIVTPIYMISEMASEIIVRDHGLDLAAIE